MKHLLLAVAILYGSIALVVFPKWTVDDAYITYRYARNLAEQGQLTWNVGEDPVEGYTGVLLPVVLAAGIRLGLDPDVLSKTIGVLAFYAAGAALYLLLRRFDVNAGLRAVLLLLYAAAPIGFTHALSGLETTLFCALITVSFLLLHTRLETPERSGVWDTLLFASLLMTTLTRPEGAVLTGASLLVLLGAAFFRESRRSAALTLMRFLLVFALPGLAYFLWRCDYYGQFLPNTYYAKTYHWMNWESVRSVADFLATYFSAPAAACLALYASAPRSGWKLLRNTNRATLLTLASFALFFILVTARYARFVLIMNYSYRFFMPFMPLLVVTVGLLMQHGWNAAQAAPARGLWKRALPVLLILLAARQAVIYARGFKAEVQFASDTMRLLQDEHVQVAGFLRERVPANDTVIVVVDAGAIPYFSRLKTIDFGGLNDEYLSKRFINRPPEQDIVNYFYSFDAAALVFTSREWDRVVGPERTPIVDDPRFQQYVLASRYRTDAFPDYYELVYLRRDLAGDDRPEPSD